MKSSRIELLERQAFWAKCLLWGCYHDVRRWRRRPVQPGAMSVRWALGKFTTYWKMDE